MKIAVTDACIFIDIIELDLISAFFQLDIELHTTIEVVNELFPEHKKVLEAYQIINKLNIQKLSEEDFYKMEQIPFPRGLSHEDRSVIYLALNLENTIVLNSDKLVRKFSESMSIEYHGIIWLFDQLISQEVLSKKESVQKLDTLLTFNSMYAGTLTRKEIELRIKKWS